MPETETPEEIAQALSAEMDKLDHTKLIVALSAVAMGTTGAMPERHKRILIHSLALRLALRVMKPGFISEEAVHA